MPVYLDIAGGNYGTQTWETNHIGGHRFASTFVCLPDGLVYGRVREAKHAEELMKQFEEGKVNIASYRGRSCHSNEVQAAEYYLRKESGVSDISELLFKNSKKGGKKYSIKFFSQADKKTHRVKLSQDKKAVKVIKSCGDKDSSIPQYSLIAHKVA